MFGMRRRRRKRLNNITQTLHSLDRQRLLTLAKQLVYKTAVYTLVNVGITHQQRQISENNATLHLDHPKCQFAAYSVISLFSDICCFWCVI